MEKNKAMSLAVQMRYCSLATTIQFRPGGSFVSRVIEKGDCPARTDAVVYTDGNVEGDADKIALVFQRRNGAYEALSIVIPLLDAIGSGTSTAAEVSAEMQDKIHALSSNRSLSLGEGQGGPCIFGSTYSVLRAPGGWLSTPSDGTASRQPPINELAKSKGITLEQAQAFVLANRFREWQLALKDHTTPPGEN